MTHDRQDEVGFQQEGGWLIWQGGRSVDVENESGGADDDILALNLSTGRIIPVAAHEGYHQTTASLGAGRVIYHEIALEGWDPGEGDGTYWWDSATGKSLRIDPGIEGGLWPNGFDGHWAVLGQENGNESATWAYNVDTHETRRLDQLQRYYHDPHDYLIIKGTRVIDGTIIWGTLQRGAHGLLDSSVYELDLATNVTHRLYHREPAQLNRLDASRSYVAVEIGETSESSAIYAIERSTGNVTPVSVPNDQAAAFPSVGAEWVTYSYSSVHWGGFGTVAFHVPSHKRVTIVPPQSPGNAQMTQVGDKFVVLELGRNGPPFEMFRSDLYRIGFDQLISATGDANS